MPISRRSTFAKCALASGLLTAQQLDEARLAVRADRRQLPDVAANDELSDQEISEKLIVLGHLNPWQAKQLLDGKIKFTLGKYRIVDSLGQGGMGHVFKAEDPLKRVVAIKVLPREKSTPEAIANFTREVYALGSLNHARLVRALDAGNDGNVNYLVTEYVPGADLRKLVRRSGPLGMEAAANVISQVAEGLQNAHDNGIVHRDVKPGNVLVTPEGDAKLSDLGLAGPMFGNAEEDPRHGKIVGTADYLAPDHIDEPWNPVPSWDVYSLGCTLYYAVTGKVPFPGGTTKEKANAHRQLKPLDPRRLNHQLSDPFVDVIADMMAKDPAQRISTAAEVIDRLAPWTREFQSRREATGGIPMIIPFGGELPSGIYSSGGSAVRPSAMSITPLEPLGGPAPPPPPSVSPNSLSPGAPVLPPLPPTPNDEQRFAMPVVPPPVIAHPMMGWEWDSSSAVEAPLAESQLRDTLPDLPSGPENSSNSEVSISLVVEPPRRIPLWLLMSLVLTPVALAGLVLLVMWWRETGM